MSRRIEYEQLKGKKVRQQIECEQGKIDKIRLLYVDRHAQMLGKAEEMEKDLKFAQMLMKTYVDQIARERVKIERQKEEQELLGKAGLGERVEGQENIDPQFQTLEGHNA